MPLSRISFEGQEPRLLDAAKKVAARVPKAMLVGGFVRDAILGIPSKDADVETYGIEAESLETILRELFDGNVETVGKSFGIFKVFLGDGFELDVAIPRRESKTGPGHTGFEVEGDPHLDPKDAARRRDFTINSMAADPNTGELFDPFNGQTDLETRTLRVVDASTFVDDPLRVYRGIQFTARFNLTVERATLEFMRLMISRGDLNELSAERVTDEWKKLLLKAEQPSIGFELMRTLGLIRRDYPELHALIDTPQEPEWHPEGDVWIHTMMVVDQAARISKHASFNDQERLMIILGALCHDLGKPSTTHVADKDGIPRIRSLGHEEAGVLPTKELLSRLRFGETIEHAAVIAAQDHLKAGMLAREVEKGTLNDEQYVNAVRKLLKRIKPLDWKILLATSEADFRGRGLSNVDIGPYGPGLLFAKTVAEHSLDADGVMPLLAGRDLMPYGVKPGPDMGKLLRQVEQWRDDGVVKTPEEAREKLMELLGPPNPFQK